MYNKEQIAEYQRQYYQKNKKQIGEKQRQYRQDNKEQIGKQKRQYRQDNKEQITEQKRQYQQKNKERLAKQDAQYYQENKEQIKDQRRQYRINHPHFEFLGERLPLLRHDKAPDGYVWHHTCYDHADPEANLVLLCVSEHSTLHHLLRSEGKEIPHINEEKINV